MQAEIVSIGTELILGKTLNSNASYLGQKIAGLDLELAYQTTVDDNQVRLFAVLKRALHRSDVTITTGGLGPTVDDITLEVISQATQKKLILSPAVLKAIKEHFKKRHLPMPKENLRQALVPEEARVLKNDLGTAPGLIIPFEKKVLVALPGVPAEMRPMVEEEVIAYLDRHFAGEQRTVSRTIKTTGLAESQVNQKIKDILKSKPPLTAGIYAHIDSVDVHLSAKAKSKSQAERLLKQAQRKVHSRLKEHIYGYDSQVLEEVVAQALNKNKKTIAVAESCTGGLVSKRLTNISGSSQYFPLGIIAYSNEQKKSLLGIPAKILRQFGAVSPQVAELMAQNIRQLAKTDLGLGVTGIAGPKGASKDKPVGLVYIALSTPRKTLCQEFHFHGGRKAVRRRASQTALDLVRQFLVK